MSIIVKQIGINKYLVQGEVVRQLSTALSIAKVAARDLSELTGIRHTIAQEIWF